MVLPGSFRYTTTEEASIFHYLKKLAFSGTPGDERNVFFENFKRLESSKLEISFSRSQYRARTNFFAANDIVGGHMALFANCFFFRWRTKWEICSRICDQSCDGDGGGGGGGRLLNVYLIYIHTLYYVYVFISNDIAIWPHPGPFYLQISSKV